MIEHPQYMGAMLGSSFPQMQTSVMSDDPRQSRADDSRFADGKPKAQNGGFSSFPLHSSGSKAFSSRQFVCWLGRDLWYPFWAMILFLVTLRTPHVSLSPGGCSPPWCFPCLKTFISISPAVFLGRLVPLNVNTFLIKKKRGVCVKLG